MTNAWSGNNFFKNLGLGIFLNCKDGLKFVNTCVIKMATVTQIRPLNSHVLATAILGLLSRLNFSLRLTVLSKLKP